MGTQIWPGHSAHSKYYWDGNVVKLSTIRFNHETFALLMKLLRRWYKNLELLLVAILPILTKSSEEINLKENKSKRWREKTGHVDIL